MSETRTAAAGGAIVPTTSVPAAESGPAVRVEITAPAFIVKSLDADAVVAVVREAYYRGVTDGVTAGVKATEAGLHGERLRLTKAAAKRVELAVRAILVSTGHTAHELVQTVDAVRVFAEKAAPTSDAPPWLKNVLEQLAAVATVQASQLPVVNVAPAAVHIENVLPDRPEPARVMRVISRDSEGRLREAIMADAKVDG